MDGFPDRGKEPPMKTAGRSHAVSRWCSVLLTVGLLAAWDGVARGQVPEPENRVAGEALDTASGLLTAGRLDDALRIVWLVRRIPGITDQTLQRCREIERSCQQAAIGKYLRRTTSSEPPDAVDPPAAVLHAPPSVLTSPAIGAASPLAEEPGSGPKVNGMLQPARSVPTLSSPPGETTPEELTAAIDPETTDDLRSSPPAVPDESMLLAGPIDLHDFLQGNDGVAVPAAGPSPETASRPAPERVALDRDAPRPVVHEVLSTDTLLPDELLQPTYSAPVSGGQGVTWSQLAWSVAGLCLLQWLARSGGERLTAIGAWLAQFLNSIIDRFCGRVQKQPAPEVAHGEHDDLFERIVMSNRQFREQRCSSPPHVTSHSSL